MLLHLSWLIAPQSRNGGIEIFNKQAQVLLRNKISLYGRGKMKWAAMTADSFQLLAPFYNFKLLCLACCLFNFLRVFTNYAADERRCDGTAPLSPLSSISISCEWNKWGSTFIPHGSRSHNLIHLCDKLHYEGSQ